MGKVKTLNNILTNILCFRCFLSKDSSGSQSSGPSRLIGGDRPDSRDTSHSEYQETRSETLTHSDTSGGRGRELNIHNGRDGADACSTRSSAPHNKPCAPLPGFLLHGTRHSFEVWCADSENLRITIHTLHDALCCTVGIIIFQKCNQLGQIGI